MNEAKLQFAHEMLRFEDPEQAAWATFTNPRDAVERLVAAKTWLMDDIVQAEMRRLAKALPEKDFLPTRAQTAREVWKTTVAMMPGPDRNNGFMAYAKIMGYLDKAGGDNDNVTNVTNVLIMPPRTPNWESEARIQQIELQARAKADLE